ncbi:MAG: septum formation initiator family protein [Deltaproteobacteria bacterium]|nr:septum formation initiator family protein [Deltaproteobacteria bacterium]
MKIGRYILIILLILGYLILFGKNGIVDNYRLGKKLTALSAGNEELAREIESLRAEVLLLRKDAKYIEGLARQELGMVKRRDLIYRYSGEAAAAPKDVNREAGTFNTEIQAGL